MNVCVNLYYNFDKKKHHWWKRLDDNVECWCSVANTNIAITLQYDVHYAIPGCPSWQWQSQWQWQSSLWQWQWQWSPGAPRSTIACACSSPPVSMSSTKHSKRVLVNFHNTCGHVFVSVVVGIKFSEWLYYLVFVILVSFIRVNINNDISWHLFQYFQFFILDLIKNSETVGSRSIAPQWRIISPTSDVQ